MKWLSVLFLLAGCATQHTGAPASLGNDTHRISEGMLGIYTSEGSPKGCRWAKNAPGGTRTGYGSGRAKHTVTFTTSEVGGKFYSSKCATWRRAG